MRWFLDTDKLFVLRLGVTVLAGFFSVVSMARASLAVGRRTCFSNAGQGSIRLVVFSSTTRYPSEQD